MIRDFRFAVPALSQSRITNRESRMNFPNRYGRVEADTYDGARGKLHILPLGCRDSAASADDHADDRAFDAAEETADHAANACADARRPGFVTDSAALEDLRC